MASSFTAALNQLGKLSLVAARSLIVSLLGAVVLGIALALLSFLLLRDHPPYGYIVAVVSFFEVLTCGAALGAKRAVAIAAAEGFRSLGLGSQAVRLIFDNLLGRADAADAEKPWIARGVQKLPLAQAEGRLRSAVNAVLATEPTAGGGATWLRRSLQAKLLAAVQTLTLRRFREENAANGRVDLVKVRAELESSADGALANFVRRDSNRLTILVCVALIALAISQAVVFRVLVASSPAVKIAPLGK